MVGRHKHDVLGTDLCQRAALCASSEFGCLCAPFLVAQTFMFGAVDLFPWACSSTHLSKQGSIKRDTFFYNLLDDRASFALASLRACSSWLSAA